MYSLFESLARNLNMTLVIPPIVRRFPFANDELSAFADAVQEEFITKRDEVRRRSIEVELKLNAEQAARAAEPEIQQALLDGARTYIVRKCRIVFWVEGPMALPGRPLPAGVD